MFGDSGSDDEMSFWKSIYYFAMVVNCFVLLYIVLVMRWHGWERVVFLVPVGSISGWFEVVLFSVCGCYSVLWGVRELGIGQKG